MQVNAPRYRYEALDGLRGVAALTVMFGHFGLLLDLFWWPNGMLAVDTFFVMSGFVIAHAYGERLRGGLSPWTYLYRRIVRLYPMFLAGLLIGAAILLYGARGGALVYETAHIARGIALNLFYIPYLNTVPVSFEVGQVFPADPPAWSLFFEMLASGAFLLLFDLRRSGLVLATAFWFVALVAASLYYGSGRNWLDINTGYYTSNLLGGLPRVGFGFSLGVLLQRVANEGAVGRRLGMWIGRVPYVSFLLYAAGLAMFLFPKSVHGLYPLLAVAVVAPALVFVGAHIRLRPGLERNVAVFLGWISYPIYCLHYPIVRLTTFFHGGDHGAGYRLMAAGALASLALAVALTRWYEEPVRAMLFGRVSLSAQPRLPEVN